MNKINLENLISEVYSELRILPAPQIQSILRIGNTLTADEILLDIIKSTLLEFERYYPVKKTLKLPAVKCSTNIIDGTWVDSYYGDNPNCIVFYDNVEQVFFNLLPESDLAMIPLAVKRLQMSPVPSHPTDYRQFEYQSPNLYGVQIGSYRYYSGLFKYPVIVDMRNTEVVQLKNSWLLLMPYGNDTYRTFKSDLIVHVCDAILDVKDNFEVPGIPVNIFGAIPKIRDRHQELVRIEFSQAQISWGWD
jgi:hypothetical protein